MALATRNTAWKVNETAGWEENHCVVVAATRAVAKQAGETTDDTATLGTLAPAVKEQLQALLGQRKMTDDGAWYGNVGKALEALGVGYEEQHYFCTGADRGNPYSERREAPEGAREGMVQAVRQRNRYGYGDRRYDCPTVARWVRDNPEATALLRVRGHVGFVDEGEVFDLNARDRVDYALVVTTEDSA